ncbi:hypothetical protein T05_5031 [Trichinella murrelli]|uniref:Uncharacterized protein n=1 Tax=Trichinella murrelli TaxID=144512 RepID=A0A0V0T1L0_9BILA|nr:hypothetical protein T05_5031 [Trichinella murrelli]
MAGSRWRSFGVATGLVITLVDVQILAHFTMLSLPESSSVCDHTDRALGLRDVVLQNQHKSFSWRRAAGVSSISDSIAADHVLMAAIPEHGLRQPGIPHMCGQSAVQLKRGQSLAFVALFSQECQGSGIETGLYLTTCLPEFFFIEQHLPEDLPQRFLYRPEEAF